MAALLIFLGWIAKEMLKADVIIAGAGMAAALPGIVKSLLCRWKKSDIPVIGVAFQGDSEQNNLAAVTSIKCLPGQPVELCENGEPYFGLEGFLGACTHAVEREFLPKKPATKEAKLGFRIIE